MAVFPYNGDMAIHMSKTIQEERLRWVLPIVNKEIKLIDVAKVCPYSKRSLERWVAAYREGGENDLEPRSTEPKTQPRETPIHVKERVIALRKKTKLCSLKLHWRLQKEGITLHERTIGKILKQEGLARKYRVKRIKYKYLRAERQPGDLLEIDVKHVPGTVANRAYYQYTAIDCSSRWRHLRIYDGESSYHTIHFLKEVLERFPHTIKAIKTDNHSTFTNYYTGTNKRSDMTVKHIHALDRFCAQHTIVHYLIDPGKPAQNGTVERSHRSDQERLYDDALFRSRSDLRRKLRIWNNDYNDLEHCGLNGKTPNEYLKEYQLTNPPKVCT
jgi:transposase InsO family protein